MSLSDFVDRQLIPDAFEMADRIFPEFVFKRHGNKWISGNTRKIDGTMGDSKQKVYIYEDNPYLLKDWRGEKKQIITYIAEQEGLSRIDAIKYLAKQCSIQLPEQWTDEHRSAFEEKHREMDFHETVNNFFLKSLNNESNEMAAKHREYIRGRGYDNPASEIGFIPSQEALRQYLKEKGFVEDNVSSAFFDSLSKQYKIGSSHQLTIPWRDPRGHIVSFVFRDITLDKGDKYLYMTRFKKGDHLFNLKNNRKNKESLVIVEGFPDSITAHLHDMDNVAALGGLTVSDKQLDLIKESGAGKVILCLDGDERGTEAIPAAVEKIRAARARLYVVSWPDSCSYKDPDELIKSEGIDSFKALIQSAKAWYNYLANEVFEKVPPGMSDQARDTAIDQLISIGGKISAQSDRDAFLTEVDQYGAHINICRDTLSKKVDEERQLQEVNKQIEKVDRERRSATESMKKGDLAGAKAILSNIGKQSNIEVEASASFEDLLIPATEAGIREVLKSKPDNLNSGFKIGNEDLLIPAGAITIIAAPTTHGKTTFLINLALNISGSIEFINTDKRVYFFSYEEDKEAIIAKTLRTYINKELSVNNYRSIKSWFKEDTDKYIDEKLRDSFRKDKDRFFNERIANRRLNIFYPEYTLNDLVGAIRYVHEHGNAGVIFIDYIQQLYLSHDKSRSRQEELKEICLELKKVAVKTGLPLILGAQFNREVVRPDLIHPTNLGEAGDIERIANLSIGFWNNQFAPLYPKSANQEAHIPSDTLDILIMKNRDGQTGLRETFYFNGNTGKISHGHDGLVKDFNKKSSTTSPIKFTTATDSTDYKEATRGS